MAFLDIGDATLRPWRQSDVAALVRYANNARIAAQLRDIFPHPYTPEDARDWTARAAAQEPQTNFAIARGEEAIGGIGLVLLPDIGRRSAEIGYWLGEPFWGQGITTRAVAAVTAWGFATFDLVRISAGVFEGNTASMRVLEKSGYELEARLRRAATKNGRTFDVFLYASVLPQ